MVGGSPRGPRGDDRAGASWDDARWRNVGSSGCSLKGSGSGEAGKGEGDGGEDLHCDGLWLLDKISLKCGINGPVTDTGWEISNSIGGQTVD